MPVAGDRTDLHTAAQIYLGLGWPVIPVCTDPARGKAAAVEWKAYQRRKPTQGDLDRWFAEGGHTGLAILTGPISGLAVLDFDDPALAERFTSEYSDLAETRTVRTRRGVHLYFRLPPHLGLASKRIPGLDVLAGGRYVVAPPTIIDGHAYTIVRGGLPRLLDANAVGRLERFLDQFATVVPLSDEPKNRNLGPSGAFKGYSSEPSPEPPSPSLAACDLIGLYHFLASQGSRNQALFQVSLRARDTGWEVHKVEELLVDVHVVQPPNGSHRPETHEKRQREAVRTIHSAFSRRPRPVQPPETPQLPNRVREKLFQSKLTCAVRVIEGLRLKGIQPGQTFTEAQARELLGGVVGHHSIREVLTAVLDSGEYLFERQSAPSGHPLAANAAAPRTQAEPISKCFEITAAKPKLIRRGRPTITYVMPGNLELAAKLGVSPSRQSDPFTLDDLTSAAKTRQAAHREYIKRRPGGYPRSWLAQRLGVSVTTEQRYNRLLPLTVTPMYTATPIFWWNLNKIPLDLDIPGLFLQDERGKRYPARQVIARRLLSQKRQVTLLRQGFNYYCREKLRMPFIEREHLYVPVPKGLWEERNIPAYICDLPQVRPPRKAETTAPSGKADTAQPATPSHSAQPAQKKRRRKRYYQQPLPDLQQESLAQRLCTLIRRLANDPSQQLSQVTARKLVDRYAPHLIEKALQRLEKDRHIHSPAGWLIIFLRSESKARNGQNRERI